VQAQLGAFGIGFQVTSVGGADTAFIYPDLSGGQLLFEQGATGTGNLVFGINGNKGQILLQSGNSGHLGTFTGSVIFDLGTTNNSVTLTIPSSSGTIATVTSAGVFSPSTILNGNGTVSLPSYSFASQSNLGFYKIATNEVGFSAAGILQSQFDGFGVTAWNGDGFFFGANTTTRDLGLTRLAAGSLALGNGTFSDISGTLSLAHLSIGNGTAGTPAYNFASDTSTGFYRVGAGIIGWSSSSALEGQLDNFGVTVWQGNGYFFGTGTGPRSAGFTWASSNHILLGNGTFTDFSGTLQLAELGFGGTAGSPDSGISRLNTGIIGVGTGAAASTAGTLVATTLQLASTSGPTWTSGSAAPSSTPAYGSMYSCTAGGVGLTNLYVYTVAGWVAIV
jgi:hypothetical protein